MPVQFECPHCDALIEQTKKNRELPRVKCQKCQGEFSTQWARSVEDQALPRGPVVSERFELARNFCNKLWNASRFVLLNLEGFEPGTIAPAEFKLEDHWILSRLSTVTQQVTADLENYRYADAARTLYDFAWSEFCGFYVEMAKDRLTDDQTRPMAQRILAHTLDVLLRLLHPMIPFITEGVWELLVRVAPCRGLPLPCESSRILLQADWPAYQKEHQNAEMEEQFARFQQVLGALREIRSRQGVAPKQGVRFSVRCDHETVNLLRPMQAYFGSMAMAQNTGCGPDCQPPRASAQVSLPGMEVFVDLAGLIDVEAEIARNKKELDRIRGMIQGKEKKLSNASFVQRAPKDIVAREQESLEQLRTQQKKVQAALDALT
jgi:valyl-tRNA synthetase